MSTVQSDHCHLNICIFFTVAIGVICFISAIFFNIIADITVIFYKMPIFKKSENHQSNLEKNL